MDVHAVGNTSTGPSPAKRDDAALMGVARKLEASFLSEMLKSSGLGKTPDSFGGGEGEDQFSSFLREAQAEKMVESGGIGLAEHIFESLKGRNNGDI
ncbi:Rod binding protein [Aquimixticola soesokkakensis]|uniref:Rod binding protein n=1 Tax=Aquimixticola soesokkakensis TaxID=1519096 RepID=A0A1Y5RC15_9RHOB|nr:rod-binding protein [Aquimixticola soesokkakensis]SLN13815.1 Rod binding protein [Aquimixticola soesokkakensis]